MACATDGIDRLIRGMGPHIRDEWVRQIGWLASASPRPLPGRPWVPARAGAASSTSVFGLRDPKQGLLRHYCGTDRTLICIATRDNAPLAGTLHPAEGGGLSKTAHAEDTARSTQGLINSHCKIICTACFTLVLISGSRAEPYSTRIDFAFVFDESARLTFACRNISCAHRLQWRGRPGSNFGQGSWTYR